MDPDTAAGARQLTLITGAAGFIGSALANRLAIGGWSVRGIDDCRTGDWGRVSVPVERIARPLEAMALSELRDACRGVEVVWHLAAEKHNTPGVSPERMIAVNIAATHRLFEAACAERVRRIVFSSSVYVYGSRGPGPMSERDAPSPTTLYGVSKLAGEHLLHAAQTNHGVEGSVARLFFVFGPGQLAAGGYPSVIVRNFTRIRHGQPPVVNGDGEQSLDYVFVDDCVAGLVALGMHRHSGLVVNLAGGTRVSVNELTGEMLEIAESRLSPVFGPADWTAGTHRWGAAEVASEMLGWRASTPLGVGLRSVWEAGE